MGKILPKFEGIWKRIVEKFDEVLEKFCSNFLEKKFEVLIEANQKQ